MSSILYDPDGSIKTINLFTRTTDLSSLRDIHSKTVHSLQLEYTTVPNFSELSFWESIDSLFAIEKIGASMVSIQLGNTSWLRVWLNAFESDAMWVLLWIMHIKPTISLRESMRPKLWMKGRLEGYSEEQVYRLWLRGNAIDSDHISLNVNNQIEVEKKIKAYYQKHNRSSFRKQYLAENRAWKAELKQIAESNREFQKWAQKLKKTVKPLSISLDEALTPMWIKNHPLAYQAYRTEWNRRRAEMGLPKHH